MFLEMMEDSSRIAQMGLLENVTELVEKEWTNWKSMDQLDWPKLQYWAEMVQIQIKWL